MAATPSLGGFLADDRGQTMGEYGMILALGVLMILGALAVFRSGVDRAFRRAGSEMGRSSR